MTQSELLDPEHPGPKPVSQPVQRGAAKPAAPDHDRLVMLHRRSCLPAQLMPGAFRVASETVHVYRKKKHKNVYR